MQSNLSFEAILEQLADLISDRLKTSIHAELSQLQPAEELLMSPSEAAKLFTPKISVRTLQTWTKSGKIPCHSVGRRKFYKKSEIVESLQKLRRYQSE